MLDSICIRAPAKLNLHLRVLPKRDDGFHSIESVFQAVNLYDELRIVKNTNQSGCIVRVKGMELPPENTLTSAYAEFCNLTGVNTGIFVELTKKIPSCAGLGGGSSDAAALLSALDKMFNTRLLPMQKNSLAAKVGSDVAFFLSGGCAVVTGRGEFIREIALRTDLYFLVVQPDAQVSTRDAYVLVDRWMSKSGALSFPKTADLENMYLSPVGQWGFKNSFTEPLVEQYPIIAAALADLQAVGAEYADMSGSGSAVYGVFCKMESAKNAYTQMCCRWKCWLLQSCIP